MRNELKSYFPRLAEYWMGGVIHSALSAGWGSRSLLVTSFGMLNRNSVGLHQNSICGLHSHCHHSLVGRTAPSSLSLTRDSLVGLLLNDPSYPV